eukprot:4058324-Amphidinium_carterae.1
MVFSSTITEHQSNFRPLESRSNHHRDHIAEIIGAILDIHNKVKEDNCCMVISQSDVRRCGQNWAL